MSGTAGIRNRASWWGKILSRAMPESADVSMGLACVRRNKNNSGNAGPRS